MEKLRIAEFEDDGKVLFFVEIQKTIEVEFLKYFTKKKFFWEPLIIEDNKSGYTSIDECFAAIEKYKKGLPKYHYIK